MSFLSRQCISLSIQFSTDTLSSFFVFLFLYFFFYTRFLLFCFRWLWIAEEHPGLSALDLPAVEDSVSMDCFGSIRFGTFHFFATAVHGFFLPFPFFFSFLFLYHTIHTLLLLPSRCGAFRCGGLFFGSSSGIWNNDFPQLSTADYTDTFNELQALSTKAVHGGAIIKAVSII